MARLVQLSLHRSWEDWTALLCGAVLIVSPAFDSAMLTPVVLLNAIVVGFIILCLAMSELSLIERWEERAYLLCGLWMMLAPLALGYFGSGSLWIWHMAIGAVVALLAVLELWQDGRGET